MIDTDKYEGHTEGPWTVFVDDNDDLLLLQIEGPTHTIAYDIDRPGNSSGGSNEANKATANLIADAPLLLDLLIDARRMVKQLHDMLDEDDGFNWAINNIGEQEMIWWNPEAIEGDDEE